MNQATLLLIKPDAFHEGKIGQIFSLIKAAGLQARQDHLFTSEALQELIPKHYEEHVGKPFYGTLVGFMSCGPILACVITGEDATNRLRDLVGATNPAEADPASIRGALGHCGSGPIHENLVHASDSIESADRELHLWGFFD